MDVGDAAFTGSVPECYERFLVPLIFEQYAADLAERVVGFGPDRVLEIAAGTGVVTRAMAERLPDAVEIVATDLNQAMLDQASTVGTARPVEWRCADVGSMPFPDASFDAVVCQFSVMFFPDRVGAFTEVRRVLRPGGSFAFSVWDRLARNEFPDEVSNALAALFPDDPPRFMERTPHGHHDVAPIRTDLTAAGFDDPADVDAVEFRSTAVDATVPAIAFCQGTPLRAEIEARRPGGLDEVTVEVARHLADRFGATDLDGLISAFVVTARAG